MRLRSARKFRENEFQGGEMMDDFSRYDGRGRPGIINLYRREFIAVTLRHAADLRCMPGGGILPGVGQA